MTNRFTYRWLLTLGMLLLGLTFAACSDDKGTGGGEDPDTTSPAQIVDFNCDSIVGASAYLSWTAPGDDGNTGTASSYDLKYSTDSTTLVAWTGASAFGGEPSPSAAGSSESCVMGSLTAGETYFAAIKAEDESGNRSEMSNIVRFETEAPDNTPPAAIVSLHVDSIISGNAYLSWTAPGDDGNAGTADEYDLRYSTDSSALVAWTGATQAAGEPTPSAAGAVESFVINGILEDTRYFIAVKASDEADNVSNLSNIAVARWSSTVGLELPQIQTSECDQVQVPIVVTNFTDVAGVEIHVAYEPAQMTFDSVSSAYLSAATIGESGGTVNILWMDMSMTNPLTVTDLDTLAVLHFSDLTGTSTLTFDAATELVDITAAPFTVDAADGSVTCTGK